MFKSMILVGAMFFGALAGPVFAATGPAPGAEAPDFSLQGHDGKTYKLSDMKGSVVVLEWFNQHCPYVKKFYESKTMQTLQKEQTAKKATKTRPEVKWFTVVSSVAGKEGHLDAASAAKLREELGMQNTAILLDPKGDTGKAFGAKTTPHMYIVGKDGKLVYQGAIDDRPSATKKSLEGAQNYVVAALTAMEKGEPIKNASTAPYGCSVKY